MYLLFEPWSSSEQGDRAETMVGLIVRFMRGRCTDTWEKVARLLVLFKPDGGLRCLALSGFIRRFAMKATAAACVPQASRALGAEQCAIRQAGAVAQIVKRSSETRIRSGVH